MFDNVAYLYNFLSMAIGHDLLGRTNAKAPNEKNVSPAVGPVSLKIFSHTLYSGRNYRKYANHLGERIVAIYYLLYIYIHIFTSRKNRIRNND